MAPTKEDPDPAMIRMQRMTFLFIIRETNLTSSPIVIDLSDNEDTPPRKKRRLPSTQAIKVAATEASGLNNASSTRNIRSPFQLTKIKDLPDSENIDTVTLHDILGNPLVHSAWIFNYCFDVDWTMQHFDPDVRTSVAVKIIHGSWRSENRNKKGVDDACRRWENVNAIQAYLPDAFGTHHTKMIILFRRDDVAEIVIHTANMLPGDWGHATQAAWRSPTLEMSKGSSSSNTGRFADNLRIGSGERFKFDFLRYLKAYGKKLDVLVQEISKYDFSPIRGALIGSVPSKLKNVYHEDSHAQVWGHAALFHALKEIRRQRRASTSQPDITHPRDTCPHIAMQCSSVATLKAGWLEDTLLHAMKADMSNEKHPITFSVIYPTPQDVGSSLDGYGGGGSIHMKIQSDSHQKQVSILRPHLCRWTRGGDGEHAGREFAAPHIKTYISFERKPTVQAPAPPIRWALLTSSNLSTQAWGSDAKMPTDKAKKKVKFDVADAEVHIQSYELGVLVWPELWDGEEASGTGGGNQSTMVPVFGKDMPRAVDSKTLIGLRMPYDMPLTPYKPEDDPWSPNVPHVQPDRYGRTWPVDESWFAEADS